MRERVVLRARVVVVSVTLLAANFANITQLEPFYNLGLVGKLREVIEILSFRADKYKTVRKSTTRNLFYHNITLFM